MQSDRAAWCEWRDRSSAFCRSQHPAIKILQAPHSSYKVCVYNLILVDPSLFVCIICIMHLFVQHWRRWTTRSWGSRECLYSGRYGGLWCMDGPFATERDIWIDQRHLEHPGTWIDTCDRTTVMMQWPSPTRMTPMTATPRMTLMRLERDRSRHLRKWLNTYKQKSKNKLNTSQRISWGTLQIQTCNSWDLKRGPGEDVEDGECWGFSSGPHWWPGWRNGGRRCGGKALGGCQWMCWRSMFHLL